MNALVLTLLVGLLYILIVGGMSLLRREGLSIQFAFETLALIGLALLLGWVANVVIDPILLFFLLYLITMRARLLTDLANLLFKRRGYKAAERLYRIALRLFPDRSSRFVVQINWGIARLLNRELEEAIALLEGVLADATAGGLGRKYEAACRYNLGVAYRKAGEELKAVRQFTLTTDLFPASLYGLAAEKALKERRKRTKTATTHPRKDDPG